MFGINNLNIKHHAKNIGGLYATTFINKHIANGYLATLLQSNQRNVFISFSSLTNILKEQDPILSFKLKSVFQKQQCYFIDSNKSHLKLDKLNKDINRIQFKAKDSVVVYIPDQVILSSEHKSRIHFFNSLNKLAKLKNLHVTTILFGHEYNVLNHWLMSQPSLFFGISSLHKINTTQFVYQINYWISAGEVSANDEYTINQESDQTFSAVINAPLNENNKAINTNDNDVIHIAETAIEPAQKINITMRRYKNNQTLFEQIQQAQSCIIVLSVYEHEEVHGIATALYYLRKKFGLKFKLVLREMKRCLRYSDESFLSQVGVNLILPPSISFSRLMNMLETLQRQKTSTIIPDSTDELMYLENTSRYAYKGYTATEDFIYKCNRLIERHEQTKLQFALIKLDLLPGIEIDSCLSMCNIKRDGDIITACSNSLYLLLSSIRENDIQPALSHIFKLPITDMFSHNTIYTTPHSIKSQLPDIHDRAINIDDDSANLPTTTSLLTTGIEDKEMHKEFAYAIHKPLEL